MTETLGQLEADAAAKCETTRHLNDRLRTTGQGGRTMLTEGVAGLSRAEIAAVVRGVAAFDDFNADNDPHREHDCACLSVEGYEVIWKIDYYDRALRCHSPDPADPAVTTRVLTIMLAEEY